MALSSIGCPAISLTGWQAGFHTDRAYTRARIKRLDCERIESELSRNRVVAVSYTHLDVYKRQRPSCPARKGPISARMARLRRYSP